RISPRSRIASATPAEVMKPPWPSWASIPARPSNGRSEKHMPSCPAALAIPPQATIRIGKRAQLSILWQIQLLTNASAKYCWLQNQFAISIDKASPFNRQRRRHRPQQAAVRLIHATRQRDL